MSLPHKALPYRKAAALVQEKAAALVTAGLRTEQLPLLDAMGRVLAEPLVADRDQPPFPRATRDGFAARAADWKHRPLSVAGLLRAGEAWQGAPLAEGQCLEIMTGAPVPAEVDCVAMIEHVSRTDGEGGTVVLQHGRSIATGDNIVAIGAEAAAGATLLPAGTRLNAHGVAIAAACGYESLHVHRKPRVAILPTGDELVDVHEDPLPHQIRNSNSYTLAAQVRALGGEPLLTGPVKDDADALEAAIEAVSGADLLLLSGGVSMGKFDLVEPALAALGGEFYFTGAQIQPGRPVVFGSLPGARSSGAYALSRLPFFGLPGNPVSTIVCFALFVAPLLASLGGERGYSPRFVEARLATPVRGRPGLTRFLPAGLTYAMEGAVVTIIPWQGSGDLASTARANCFVVVPDTLADLRADSTVTVLLA